ncbi:short chain dehydrogenase reductase [Amylocarpus encephaloides]|uniref:Short chain dehydrogenase reductase n=1 Tax=Amylocarpus encephaloides TaxID=45428 RepID=A0A9P7YFX9_9HELO|nr:short chain dehydrogenase reductase [Amylocarpus encephaloides]
MASYLITGCSRGLGLAFCSLLASRPASEVGKIFATSRKESAALKELVDKNPSKIFSVHLDTLDDASIKAAAKTVEAKLNGGTLDILINNAGLCEPAANAAAMNNLEKHLSTNVVGVHLVTQAFLSLMQKGGLKKIVNITSTLGSIEMMPHYASTGLAGYNISKSALNALTVQYSLDLGKEGFTVIALSPGWLKTDLGGKDWADLTVEEGAQASLDKITGAGKEQNGQFMNIHIKGWEKPKGGGRNFYDGVNPSW